MVNGYVLRRSWDGGNSIMRALSSRVRPWLDCLPRPLIVRTCPYCITAMAIVQLESSITVLDSSSLVQRAILRTKGTLLFLPSASHRALVPSAYCSKQIWVDSKISSQAWELPRGEVSAATEHVVHALCLAVTATSVRCMRPGLERRRAAERSDEL